MYKMFKNTVLILCFVVACRADVPVNPPPGVYCGEVPSQIYGCLKLRDINVMGKNVTRRCGGEIGTCDLLTCTFREAGWLVGDKVDKKKVSEAYERYGTEHTTWAAGVQRVMTDCLEKDLPAQGVLLNCPAYDITWCAFASFLKGALPSQWSSSEACSYPQQYAAACPVCPGECFTAAVPIGSCNACITLPRTP